MKIYLPTGRRNHIVLVTPGLDSDVSDFFDHKGMPLNFTVKFVAGAAEVPSPLGKYLVDKGVAQKTALIEPAVAVAMVGQETRRRNHRMLTDAYHETVR